MNKSIRVITATVLMGSGLLIFGICGFEITKPERIDRGWLVSRALLGVFPMVGGGILLAGLRPSRRAYLRSIFFQMLESGQMEMTVLQFAMKARIDGAEAKAYLDDRAREYEATFNVGPEGQVLYCFTHALPGR